MGQAFIGIENSNEFFTQHYLAAILANDLGPLLAEWRRQAAETDQRPPPQALAALHRDLFRYRERLGQVREVPGRVHAHKSMFGKLLGTLGHFTRPDIVELPCGHIPLLAHAARPDNSPVLWCIPAIGEPGNDDPALSRELLPEVVNNYANGRHSLYTELRPPAKRTVEELVTEVFDIDEAPRFVLVCGDIDIWLLERSKWAEQRYLRFELDEILGRRDSDTLDVTAALLHRRSLAPEQGSALIDTLDDNSHKHAFAVSEDLKYALQACIEALGNAAIEAIEHRRRSSKKKLFDADIADQVSRECLRFMYRLLFLFYIEARPELGYAPMGSDAYRLGYSLERLRELEQLTLDTDEARNGTYIHDSLRLLFQMIHDGATPGRQMALDMGSERARKPGQPAAGPAIAPSASTPTDEQENKSLFHTFELAPLRSHLFDPERTKLLNGVKFPNHVLRDVIEWMSLSRPSGQAGAIAGGKKAGGKRGGGKAGRRRGRISYATLGINQLGAVYEALLSYRGFFAETDLYEVKPADAKEHDVLDIAYFVPAGELERYGKNERVYDEHGDPKKYPKGTFIYRLAGRDRQTSASYYTPESLTRCLVKYALQELLYDRDGNLIKSAREILDIKICEPAMGSAAFLNEAINQLAEIYLHTRQKELGKRIPHERYAWEKQRVKMYIADNNVFGVDLNPVAVELAEVSLWLNSIYKGERGDHFVPWFGGQLKCGNSLIGARRQVFGKKEIASGRDRKQAGWLDAVPERVPLGTERPKGSVYHFLLGDRGMAVYGQGNEGKPIRAMAAPQLAAIDSWRTRFCQPLHEEEQKALIELSSAVDRLWMRHVELLRGIRERTTDPLEVWGHTPPNASRAPTTTAYKDSVWDGEMESKQVRAASPYRRLKMVMDYWCALWFWPIEEVDELPDRDEFLAELALILDSDVLETLVPEGQMDLFAPTMPADKARQLAKELGIVDVDKLVARSKRLQIVERLAKRYRFLHWELEFADLFAERGGFDLMLGNPPWIRVEWKEADVLGDADPAFVLKSLSATQAAELRNQTFAQHDNCGEYLSAHEAASGLQAFLSAGQNYPKLRGIKTNLYKAFILLVWRWNNAGGVSGLLHPEGIYDDPSGGELRAEIYLRLRRHYQMANEKSLFRDVHHLTKFSVNIYDPLQVSARSTPPGRRNGAPRCSGE